MGASGEVLVEQGRAALRSGDANRARRCFEAALGERESGAALEGLAEAVYLEREYATSASQYERAYAVYRREREHMAAGRAARSLAWITGNVLGNWAVQSGWLARARSILEEAGDDGPERGWVLIIQSFSEADPQKRESLLREAIAIGRRCGDPDVEFEALAYLGGLFVMTDRVADTLSTHIVHPPGVAALQRWGLLDRLVATGCPPIDTYAFDFGPLTLSGSPGTQDFPVAYCPRRTVLDKLLVDAASEAGAEVREGFTVKDVVVEDGHVTGVRGHSKDGKTVTEQANVVIGADGRNSLVARAVGPEQYNEKPQLLCGYYSYWSGLPTRTSSRRKGSPTRSGTPSCARPRWTRRSPAPVASTSRWASISPPVTSTSYR